MKERFSRCAWAPVPLRLIVGFGFMYHGYPKLFTSTGHSSFRVMLGQMNVPLPGIMSWAVALLEVLGGLAIFVGVFVSVAGILLILEMFVAMFAVHLSAGFSFLHITGMTDDRPTYGMPGYEVNLLYIAALICLIVGGPGVYSLGRAIKNGKTRRPDKQTVIKPDFPDRGLDRVS